MALAADGGGVVCAPREASAARGVEAGGAADGGRALEPLADVAQRRVHVAAVAHVPLQVGVVPGLVLARQAGRAGIATLAPCISMTFGFMIMQCFTTISIKWTQVTVIPSTGFHYTINLPL